MRGSTLSVHVIDARDLGSENPKIPPRARVRLSTVDDADKSRSQQSWTQEPKQATKDPVYNEVITFDIATGREMLNIEVFDVSKGLKSKVLLAQTDTDLRILSKDESQIDQMKLDQIFTLDTKVQTNDSNAAPPKIRLAIQWIYSKQCLLQDMLEQIKT